MTPVRDATRLRSVRRPRSLPGLAAALLFLFAAGGGVYADTLYDQANLRYRAGEYAGAIDLLMKKPSRTAGELNLLGWAFLKSGDTGNSIRSFSSSLELAPDLSDSYCGLGYAYLERKDFEAAKENFLRSVSDGSNNPECFLGMGIAQEMLGKRKEALASYGKALSLDPENQAAKEKISGLKSLPKNASAESLYDEALSAYRRGDYETSIARLRSAVEIEPRSAPLHVLLGWSYHRTGRYGSAEEAFRRALALEPALEEGKLGLAYASIAGGKHENALPILRELAPKQPTNEELQLALGEAYFRTGDNRSAGRVYRDLVKRQVAVSAARERLERLYGSREVMDAGKAGSASIVPRGSVSVNFRARGDYFEVLGKAGWKRTYLKGVNLGPARPGEFPSTPPTDTGTYLEWLDQIAGMSANMVRVYTILPPAFYQALDMHNRRSPDKIWLFQEVWLREREDTRDLYDRSWSDEFRNEIRDVIDLIHGSADIPYRRGHAAGIYTADISRYVFAIGLGRELEPSVALATNAANPARKRYPGEYIHVESGNPSEIWFAEMADLAIRYETGKYASQRPLAVVNWPPLDPMRHVTEANFAEEVRFRRQRGEPVDDAVPEFMNDADAVSLDVMKFRPTPAFPAGLFAAYHVYSHWPDFLFNDPEYPKAKDHEGPNRYYGYLLDLKRHHAGIPLLIAEYGLATSWGVAHVHPDGWDNGGFSEKRQAEVLTRMTRNIRDAGCAGGLVFEWMDEWWKRVSDDFTRPFTLPVERAPLWMNLLDPEQFFGILGYRSPGPVPLLRGETEDWGKGTLLASSDDRGKLPVGAPKRIHAYSDPAFLYLRLDVETGNAGEKVFDWNASQYWIALNTFPGRAGSRKIPDLPLSMETGANFLIRLAGPGTGRILIAENYNPNRRVESTAGPWKHIERKPGMKISLEDRSPFGEMVIEANQLRYGRDGSVFPPIFHNRSVLHHGTADPSSDRYSSQASWHADASRGMLEARIPWGLLYFTDPSSLKVAAGTDGHGVPQTAVTGGVAVTAIRVGMTPKKSFFLHGPADSLPVARRGAIRSSDIPVYSWRKWDEVRYESYRKAAYFSLQRIFSEMSPPRGESDPLEGKSGKRL